MKARTLRRILNKRIAQDALAKAREPRLEDDGCTATVTGSAAVPPPMIIHRALCNARAPFVVYDDGRERKTIFRVPVEIELAGISKDETTGDVTVRARASALKTDKVGV